MYNSRVPHPLYTVVPDVECAERVGEARAASRCMQAVRAELDQLGERLGLVLAGTRPSKRQRVIASELSAAVFRISAALDLGDSRGCHARARARGSG